MRDVQASYGLLAVVTLTGMLLALLVVPIHHTQAQGPDPIGKIAFKSFRTGDLDIYVMNADGSNQINLTNALGLDDSPNWSPDGSKIAFHSERDGNFEIYVMNADGTNQTNLTNEFWDDWYPIWSPDGTQIVFVSKRDGDLDIYVMNADGSNQTRLTNLTAYDNHPSWSPDGTQIVFHSNRDGNEEIYVMNADGSNQTRLTSNSVDDMYPVWSPDGTQIAYQSNRDGNWEIYTMNIDGSNEQNLTNNPADDSLAAWSPDNAHIAYQTTQTGDWEVFTMNRDGSNQTNRTNTPGGNSSPAWHSGVATGCAADTSATAYQYDTFTLTLDCTGITANVFGFQAGHTITAGDALVTAQATTYTAGTIFQGQSTLTGENTLPVYALSLQAGGTEATGDFTLGMVDYSADFPGAVTFDLINLILGNIDGEALADVQATPSSATITIIDVVDSLSGVVDPEGHALDTELDFALEGNPTIGPIDTVYNPDGTTSFTINDIHDHPDYLNVDAPSHLTCREVLSLSGDETDVTLPADLILRAGDVNDDEAIDITDATAIGQQYGQAASGELDINDDGTINILDLIHVGRNYSTAGPTDCSP